MVGLLPLENDVIAMVVLVTEYPSMPSDSQFKTNSAKRSSTLNVYSLQLNYGSFFYEARPTHLKPVAVKIALFCE